MPLLLLGPICLLVVLLVAFLPYGTFRLAARNGKVGNERSRRRTRREVRHLKRFLRNAVLLPLLIVVMIQGTLVALHYFIVPDTTMSDIFGEYHPDVTLNAPDLESWKTAMVRSRKAREVEAQLSTGGLANKTSLAATLVEHWPLHIVIPLLPLAFLAWFMRRHFFAMSQRYHYEVTRRAKRYALHTVATETREAARRKQAGYASPPGMLNENFG